MNELACLYLRLLISAAAQTDHAQNIVLEYLGQQQQQRSPQPWYNQTISVDGLQLDRRARRRRER